MVNIPPDEKVIFKQGLLGKAIITDKAVYKKGIFSPLVRYDFNDIICMFCKKRYETVSSYDVDHGREDRTVVTKVINMVLSNGKVVEFLSYTERGHSGATSDIIFLTARTLGLERTTEKVISEAINKNLPPGKLLFYEFPPPMDKIDEMIKEHRSPEEIRSEIQRIVEERIEKEEKSFETPIGKTSIIILSLFIASAMALTFALLLGLFIGGKFGLLWIIFTILLAFPVYSRIKKTPRHPL